jgi:hypothetical protein
MFSRRFGTAVLAVTLTFVPAVPTAAAPVLAPVSASLAATLGTAADAVPVTVLVHGADLAVVSGQEELVDRGQCGELLNTMRDMDFDAFRRPGMFGPARPAPAGAPVHRQLLAFLGRAL